jgi:nucleoside 2-deoxyribosyltransferase
MRIYLAAPIFNHDQLAIVQFLKDSAEEHGHEVFSPYHNSKDVWQGRAPADCTPAERKKVLDDNISYLYWADVLLAWVGGGTGYTDPGVIWEMGLTYSLHNMQIAYLDEELDAARQSMNLMLAGTVDAVITNRINLQSAMYMLANETRATVKAAFPPDVLQQEQEPIV